MMNDLEGILKCLGSGKPFRKTPVVVEKEPDGNDIVSNVTKSGWKAYGKLTDVVYAFERMGLIEDANDIIEELDEIITENGAYKG